MDGASIGLSIFATTDLCLKYGKILIEKYKTMKDAERELGIIILRLESLWFKTETQIAFLRHVWSTLPDQYQVHLHTVLMQFQLKLQQAAITVDSVIMSPDRSVSIESVMKKRGPVKRLNLALGKKYLNETIDDCKQWQEVFDPSWYLLLRLSDPVIDEHLSVEIGQSTAMAALRSNRDLLWSTSSAPLGASDSALRSSALDQDPASERMSIPYCCSTRSRPFCGDQDFIIDSFGIHGQTDIPAAQDAVQRLASIFKGAGADIETSGLLRCTGFRKRRQQMDGLPIFEIAFLVPAGLQAPRSLRQILIENDNRYPLDDRLNLAKTLARSILFLHTYRFVHKNLRPETILIFEDARSILGIPFLVGFDTFRPLDGKSHLLGDSSWEKNLYRHPRRQGCYPEEEYKMQHDIYSLGVCLLEIGVWTSFVDYTPSASTTAILDIAETLKMKEPKKKAFAIKNMFLDLTRSHLPVMMGQRYTQIAVSCLTCLDGNSNDFDQDGILDEEGVLIGIRYIEKVIMELAKIQI